MTKYEGAAAHKSGRLASGSARGLLRIRADIKVLQSGNPYLYLPLQFAKSLEPRLLGGIVAPDLLAQWRGEVERTLGREDCFGLTFTLVQAWGGHPTDRQVRNLTEFC